MSKNKGQQGFVVLPRRWVVERTFAWMGRRRCLTKDYERTVARALVWLQLATVLTLVKQLGRTPA